MYTKLLTFVLLVSFGTSATADQFVWKVPVYWPSYCAGVATDGRELERVDQSKCPIENLHYGWWFLNVKFVCALRSRTNPDFWIEAKTEACGIPQNAYYRMSRSGLGENDFACSLRVKDNDNFAVWVDSSYCAAK